MGTVGAIANVIGIGLEMINNHIKDPKNRLKAIQEYMDKVKEECEKALSTEDMAELDRLLLDIVTIIHDG